jgi:hypothetical protein
MKIRALLADDEALARKELRRLLQVVLILCCHLRMEQTDSF